MPRKKNGLGSFAFSKVNSAVNTGKIKQRSGRYPSDRGYGSTVTRSIIQEWDLESTWARWRKGIEYFYQGAYLKLKPQTATLYQGSTKEVPLKFTGYKFATKNADSRAHYVIKRQVDKVRRIARVETILNDPIVNRDNFERNEIHVKFYNPGAQRTYLLQKCIGEVCC